HSGLIAPYIENNQKKICSHCALRHHSECPCPMDRLAVLVVEAVETVDDERQARERVERLLAGKPLDDSSSVEVIAPAEKGGPPVDNDRPADREDVYLVLIRNPAGSPQVFERPLVRCFSYAEASRIRRELRQLGYESVARQVGLATAAD